MTGPLAILGTSVCTNIYSMLNSIDFSLNISNQSMNAQQIRMNISMNLVCGNLFNSCTQISVCNRNLSCIEKCFLTCERLDPRLNCSTVVTHRAEHLEMLVEEQLLDCEGISNYHLEFSILSLALIMNMLCLAAVAKSRFGMYGQQAFIISLLLSDIAVCFSRAFKDIFFHYAASFAITELSEALVTTTYIINFVNIAGMAVDQLIGVYWPFKYNDIMKRRRTQFGIFSIWLTGFILGFCKVIIYNPVVWSYGDSPDQYWPWLFHLGFHSQILRWIITLIVSIMASVIYFIVYRRVRRLGGAVTIKRTHTTKYIVTTTIVLAAFMICCTPLVWCQVVVALLTENAHTYYDDAIKMLAYSSIGDQWTTWDGDEYILNSSRLSGVIQNTCVLHTTEFSFQILLCLNQLLDPLVYALRMPEVRGRMRDIVFFWRKDTYQLRQRKRTYKKASTERHSLKKESEELPAASNSISENNFPLPDIGVTTRLDE